MTVDCHHRPDARATGRCYDLAPDVFEPDERRRVGLAVTGELPPDLEPDARIGVQNCPESALRLIADTVTGPAKT